MFKRLLKYWCILLPMVLADNTLFAQDNCPPANIGFETNSFQGWQCATGRARGFADPNWIIGSPQFDRHTLILPTDSTLDEYGKFPVHCPNGSKYSIRLGNTDVGAQAEQVSYTFTIDPSVNNYSLFFNYAVVLQNPNHSADQQPRFTAKVYNVTDNTYIDCASFDFIAGSGLPGFRQAKLDATVYYKDWATANINLQGFAGKTIRIEFSTFDCTVGGHFGYAYLDLIQDCILPITGTTYCALQDSVSLTGPPGFDSYQWYDANNKLVGNSRTLTLSPPPPNQANYSLVLKPLNGLGCQATLKAQIIKLDEDFHFKVQDTLFACPGSRVDLTAAGITNGSSRGLSFKYFKDPNGDAYLYRPNAIDTSGTFFIQATNAGGCTAVLPVVVSYTSSIKYSVKDPKAVMYPATIDLAATFTHDKNFVYTYFRDSLGRDTVSRLVNRPGTYYIRSTNSYGCSTYAPVHVIITAPPPATVSAPNTFTPNSDGINDFFYIKIDGFEILKSLNIYNRYGKQVFATKAIDNQWDGNFAGQPLPQGVYYWVYEGASMFDDTRRNQGGYITLIR